MLNKLKPKHIEKNMLFLHSRDGILDIFFGFMLIASGVNGIFTHNGWDEPWYIRFMILILLIPMLAGKFFITTPRIGYIKMNFVKGGRRKILRIFMMISLTLTIFMLLSSIFKIGVIHGQTLEVSPVILFGIIMLIMSFVAWLIGLYSLYFVGLCTGFGFFLAKPLGLESIMNYSADLFIFCIPGTIIVLYGIYRLVQFLKSHPLQNIKADYEHK